MRWIVRDDCLERQRKSPRLLYRRILTEEHSYLTEEIEGPGYGSALAAWETVQALTGIWRKVFRLTLKCQAITNNLIRERR